MQAPSPIREDELRWGHVMTYMRLVTDIVLPDPQMPKTISSQWILLASVDWPSDDKDDKTPGTNIMIPP